MALKAGVRFAVGFEDVFPNGCVLTPDAVSEGQDYNEATKVRVPSRDKVTGQRVWNVRVMDMDEELKGRAREVVIKVLADHQPVPDNGAPFSPVEFAGMTVTPYIAQNGRMAYSYRATGFRSIVAAGSRKSA